MNSVPELIAAVGASGNLQARLVCKAWRDALLPTLRWRFDAAEKKRRNAQNQITGCAIADISRSNQPRLPALGFQHWPRAKACCDAQCRHVDFPGQAVPRQSPRVVPYNVRFRGIDKAMHDFPLFTPGLRGATLQSVSIEVLHPQTTAQLIHSIELQTNGIVWWECSGEFNWLLATALRKTKDRPQLCLPLMLPSQLGTPLPYMEGFPIEVRLVIKLRKPQPVEVQYSMMLEWVVENFSHHCLPLLVPQRERFAFSLQASARVSCQLRLKHSVLAIVLSFDKEVDFELVELRYQQSYRLFSSTSVYAHELAWRDAHLRPPAAPHYLLAFSPWPLHVMLGEDINCSRLADDLSLRFTGLRDDAELTITAIERNFLSTDYFMLRWSS